MKTTRRRLRELEAENERLRLQLAHAPAAPLLVSVPIPRTLTMDAGDVLTVTCRLNELRIGTEVQGQISEHQRAAEQYIAQSQAAQGLLDRSQAIVDTCGASQHYAIAGRDNEYVTYCLKTYGHEGDHYYEQVPEQLARALDMTVKARKP